MLQRYSGRLAAPQAGTSGYLRVRELGLFLLMGSKVGAAETPLQALQVFPGLSINTLHYSIFVVEQKK